MMSLGAVGSQPINASRIPQGGEGPCRRPQHVQPSCRRSSRVAMDWRGYDSGGKLTMSTLSTAGARQSTAPDTGSDEQILTLMKGLTRSTRTADAVRRRGGRAGSLS